MHPVSGVLVLAEAEDHLRETAASGLAAGMTAREGPGSYLSGAVAALALALGYGPGCG